MKRKDKKSIIVCFSSGKDSIATVKHYMEQGYKVYLYHLRRINPPLYDEYIQAQELADYWNIPIFVDTVKLSGNHEYVEHPMKNYIIANGALQYGIREGITTSIAFGNYRTSSLQYDNFEFCGGDDIEMWDIYNSIISTIIPLCICIEFLTFQRVSHLLSHLTITMTLCRRKDKYYYPQLTDEATTAQKG